MSLLAKTTTTILGLGGANVVGCGAGGVFKTSEQSLPSEKATLGEPLSKDSDFSTAYESKIGKKYGHYLVGVKQTSNQKGWEESYERYREDKTNSQSSLSSEFGSDNVDSAYNTDNVKALNKVCESIYGKAVSSINFDSGDGNEHKLGSNLLKYCSPIGINPVILTSSDSNYQTGKIGNAEGAAKKLASTKDQKNNKFWEAQQKWFETLGSASLDQYFGQFFEGSDGNKKLKEGKNIKEICEGAYQATHSETPTTSSPKADDVAKYCSFPAAS